MSKDMAFNPDNWYYDPPENCKGLGTKPRDPDEQKLTEDIAFKAWGQAGVDRLHKRWSEAKSA
jgi:hypothetical protein